MVGLLCSQLDFEGQKSSIPIDSRLEGTRSNHLNMPVGMLAFTPPAERRLPRARRFHPHEFGERFWKLWARARWGGVGIQLALDCSPSGEGPTFAFKKDTHKHTNPLSHHTVNGQHALQLPWMKPNTRSSSWCLAWILSVHSMGAGCLSVLFFKLV